MAYPTKHQSRNDRSENRLIIPSRTRNNLPLTKLRIRPIHTQQTLFVMADDDSDVDYSDIESPLSYSVHGQQSTTQNSSSSKDRLYSASTHMSRYLAVPESEHAPLLSSGDGLQRYHSVSVASDDAAESASSRPLGILTRKISRVFQSKAYDYDNNKSSLAAVGSGERVWYFKILRRELM